MSADETVKVLFGLENLNQPRTDFARGMVHAANIAARHAAEDAKAAEATNDLSLRLERKAQQQCALEIQREILERAL